MAFGISLGNEEEFKPLPAFEEAHTDNLKRLLSMDKLETQNAILY